MSEDSHDIVLSIFREAFPDRFQRLSASHFPADVITRIREALSTDTRDESEILKNDSIGQHLVEWQRSAAFIVALTLFPEQFSDELIQEEIEFLLLDVPAHIREAARLSGFPDKNIFFDDTQTEKGAVVGP
ncbi:MAG: hypothetical protein R3F13_04190 [Prosthecobacter sp.]